MRTGPDGRRSPGNIVPANRLESDRAEDCRVTIPSPNFGGPNPNTNNYFAAGGPILSRNYFDTKVNFTASDKETIWGKYGRMWATSGGQAVFGTAGGPGLGGSSGAPTPAWAIR